MRQFEWSQYVPRFPTVPTFFPSLYGLIQVPKLPLVSPLLSCSRVYFSSSTKSKYLPIFFVFFDFQSLVNWVGKFHYTASSLPPISLSLFLSLSFNLYLSISHFLFIIIKSSVLAGIKRFVWISKSPKFISDCLSLRWSIYQNHSSRQYPNVQNYL